MNNKIKVLLGFGALVAGFYLLRKKKGVVQHLSFDGEDEGLFTDNITGNIGFYNPNFVQRVPAIKGNGLEFIQSDRTPSKAVSNKKVGELGGKENSYSISFWVKVPEIQHTYARIIEKWGCGTYPFVIRQDSNNRIICATYDGTNNPFKKSTFPLEIDTWYFIVFEIDRIAKTIRLWVNGEEDGEPSEDTTVGDINNLNDFTLGNTSDGARTWIGTIDEIKIWNKLLTQKEKLEEYQKWLL